MTRTLVIIVVCVLVGGGGAYSYLVARGGPSKSSPASDRATPVEICQKHQIEKARCPFCNPALVASLGECKGHGVAEALCYRCHPELATAFKVEGDWCATHGVPESQCEVCKSGNLPPGERRESETGKRAESEARQAGTGGQP